MIMVEIGDFNEMTVVRATENGLYLDAGEMGEILMPQKFVATEDIPGASVEVFVYRDSEDRLVATKEEPYACIDEFALLKVTAVTGVGAFLDWGLPKDLLVPFSEQETVMDAGNYYIVFIYLDDKTKRIVATSRIGRFLNESPAEYTRGEEVQILIINKNEIGYQVIVNGMHRGMIFMNETFKTIDRGTIHTAYVKAVREDGKVDLSLEKIGHLKIDINIKEIYDKLIEEEGFLALTDKTDPSIITKELGLSKKAFKRATGGLYKEGLITLEEHGIRLSPKAVKIEEAKVIKALEKQKALKELEKLKAEEAEKENIEQSEQENVDESIKETAVESEKESGEA